MKNLALYSEIRDGNAQFKLIAYHILQCHNGFHDKVIARTSKIQ
jgi:hypothetical protein